MKIVGLGGDKGGCGKTTLATNLAALAAGRGYKVALLDADPKPDSASWHDLRIKNKEALPKITLRRTIGDIDDSIINLANSHDILIIDTGGMEGPEMRYTVGYATTFIAPYNPSHYDLNTARKVESIVSLGRPLNPDMISYSVLVNVSNHPHSKSTVDSRRSLQGLNASKCLKTHIHALEVWKYSAGLGMGVSELDNEKAKSDLNNLAEEIELWS